MRLRLGSSAEATSKIDQIRMSPSRKPLSCKVVSGEKAMRLTFPQSTMSARVPELWQICSQKPDVNTYDARDFIRRAPFQD